MNAQNYTQKSLEALKTAQSMAEENRNSTIAPEHLLYALIDQDGGLIPTLLGRMGTDCNAVLSELDTAIAALPKVGSVTQVYASPETDRALRAGGGGIFAAPGSGCCFLKFWFRCFPICP